ncbi:MAG: methyl-accepting chemotaxis protein [Granulosicoccaceae bacterium]
MARSSDSFFLLGIFKDKTFQAREIRRVMALSAIYLIITSVLLGVFYHQILNNLVAGQAPLLFASEDMRLIAESVPGVTTLMAKWILAMLLVNVLLTATLAIYITRKLGHPLLAIKRTLREIGEGNLDVRLRGSDDNEFGEIADELTNAVSSIREQIRAAKSEIAQVDVDKAEPANNALRNAKMALDYFHVDSDGSSESKAA